jgi:hypothetical protein
MPKMKMVTIIKTFQVLLKVPDDMGDARVITTALTNLRPGNQSLIDTTVRVNHADVIELEEREIIDLSESDGGSC